MATFRLIYFASLSSSPWPAHDKPVLKRLRSGGADEVRDGVVWKDGAVEWQAGPGEYELLRAGK